MESFWQRVNTGSESECWPWKLKPHKSGYGQFKYRGQTFKAHRVAYALTHGGISWSTGQVGARGQLVLHQCDRRDCCNPSHLFLGQQRDNVADAVEKDRMASGETHHKAVLTTEQVEAIAVLARGGWLGVHRGRGWHRLQQQTLSLRIVGQLCGVSGKTIEQVVRGRAWTRVTGFPRATTRGVAAAEVDSA